MRFSRAGLAFWWAFGGLACAGAAATSYTFETRREILEADAADASDTAQLSTQFSGKNLVWSTKFTVGDAQDVKLYISTATADLIVNPGVYKPSKYSKPYNGTNGTDTFRHTYNAIGPSGLGFETWTGKLYYDVVSAGGLTLDNQAIGSLESYRYWDIKGLPNANPGDGIIGFADAATSVFTPGAPSWFYNLVKNKAIAEPRYGLAFGTSGKGILSIGKLAKNLIKGPLTTVQSSSSGFTSSRIKADVTVDGKILLTDQTVFLGAGVANIQPPIAAAETLFKKLGYQTSEEKVGATPGSPAVKNLFAYFDCEKPPTVGLSLPAQSELKSGQKAKNFNISPSTWDEYKNSDKNCTSIIFGTSMLTAFGLDGWVVGQQFFQGHYIDFNLGPPYTIGFADLTDPSMSG